MTTTMAPNETLDRRLAARVGTIVIARHGQPHADRSVVIDRAGVVRYMSCGAGEPGLFRLAVEGVLRAK